MKFLLDTHIFLWFVTGNEKLSPSLRLLMEEKKTNLFLSVASIWEMALKVCVGKLTLDRDLGAYVAHYGGLNEIEILPIGIEHLEAAIRLPKIHGDPFDRLLIAQALVEQMTILTVDSLIQKYEVECLK